MSNDVHGRISRFRRKAIDLQLPLLVGMMAEQGASEQEQIQRTATLVALLRELKVEPSLTSAKGRPVAVEVRRTESGPRVAINAEMLSKATDQALASAMATPMSRVLNLAPLSVGMVLQLDDEQGLRTLMGQFKASGIRMASLNRIEELIQWRLLTFEERLSRFVEQLGGQVKLPEPGRHELIQSIVKGNVDWPQWTSLYDSPYLVRLVENISQGLQDDSWRDFADNLAEMLWESLIISPQSALRQAAQTMRTLPLKGDRGQLLKVLARSLGPEGVSVPGELSAWPSFEELQQSWQDLWREENTTIGAREKAAHAPLISVFEAPGKTMGLKEPKELPWAQPLLCWTLRERAALRDLLTGMKKALAQERAYRKRGQIEEPFIQEAQPLIEGERSEWLLQVPTRLPNFVGDDESAVDRAFAATLATYLNTFDGQDERMQTQILGRLRGAYQSYLSSTKAVWERRLAGELGPSPRKIYEAMVVGLARALEWPIFVDVFEEGIDSPSLAMMPCFTLLAVWQEGAEFAPVWLPIETVGESLSQAPLRIRNVAVDEAGAARWLGDHQVDLGELRSLSTDGLLRRVQDGILMLTIHKR